MTPKKTCEKFGIEPALFNAVLLGAAVQKLAAGSGYDAHEAFELLKLGIQVKRDAEAIARYRAEQLIL